MKLFVKKFLPILLISQIVLIVGCSQPHLWKIDKGEQTYDRIYNLEIKKNILLFIGNGNLYAHNAKTGSQEWSFTKEDGMQFAIFVTSDRLVFFVVPTKLYAFDIRTGKKKWQIKLNLERLDADQLSYENNVVFIGDKTIDAKTGKEYKNIETIIPAKIRYKNMVIYSINDPLRYDFYVKAEDSKTNKVIWKFSPKINVPDSPLYDDQYTYRAKQISDPVLSKNTIYIIDFDNDVFAINPKTGKERWVFRSETLASLEYSEREPTNQLVVYKDILYLIHKKNIIYGVNAITGKLVWKSKISERPTSINASNNIVYVAAGESIYAFRAIK